MKDGDKNPNWRGGLNSVKSYLDILNLDENVKEYLLKRLYSKVDTLVKSECWNWTGWLNYSGYPEIHIGRKTFVAHRVSYVLHKGDICNLLVCHTCDTPKCINPEHLFLGTVKDNALDMVRKRRDGKPSAKLDWDKARIIRSEYNTGQIFQKELAEKFNVGTETISRVIRKATWIE